MKSNIAVVLGNGESRLDLEPVCFPEKLHLIGCNAIHRDIAVDYLVCCDKRMVNEALSESFIFNNPPIYTRERYYNDFNNLKKENRVRLLPDIPYQGTQKKDQPDHWGSGPYAVLLATVLECQTIFLIGFDLYGLEGKVNNIYKGTKNYLKPNSPNVDPSYWIYQIKKIFQLNQDKNFYVVNRDDWKFPIEWKFNNTDFVRISKFWETLDKELNIVYNNKTVD